MKSRAQRSLSALIIVGALSTLGSPSAHAVVPDSINYQGILKTAGGSPVPDGSYSVTFRIYDFASGPNPPRWSETKNITTVSGLFTTFLGSVIPLQPSLFALPNRYLGITVGADPEMTPRTAIVAVPYAYRIASVDGATGGSISGNIDLDSSTATSGNILKGGLPFIHDFGTLNTFIGVNAGNLTMSGIENTASGADALQSNTSGTGNTASGQAALAHNTVGNGNTADGTDALHDNTTGNSNSASGTTALYSNTIGVNNTAIGYNALFNNTTGNNNTASGFQALSSTTTGSGNTASGLGALHSNTTGGNNTALGFNADVSAGGLTNATAIGYGASVNASNKIRLGNSSVTVIEGQVAYTFPSDSTMKENFRPVNGDDVLRKIREFNLRSWNYIGNDPHQYRHYGPMAQEFFAAFGHDGMGTSGTPTTINSGDEAGILMIAVQALEKNNESIKAENRSLQAQIAELRELIRAQACKQK